MPYIQYEEKRFHRASLKLITVAQQICDEYMAQGYTLTLRQLYYQFVARGIIENTMKAYKNLGNIINDARLNGMIDWDAIEDRTRNLEALSTWDSGKDILENAAKGFRYDYWETQPVHIEVWVEKEALIGVIERVAFKYSCAYFACRGYSSQSEAWRAGQRFAVLDKPIKVLHLGDHDPSGIDMTRDNSDRLNLFSENADVEVIRLALNYNQVQQYNPPPNPAKMTDTRAPGYVRQFGRQSWELDALDPRVIDELISTEIEKYIDHGAWSDIKEKEKNTRAKIMKIAKKWKEK